MAITKVAESTFILSGSTGAKSVAIPGSPINGDLVIIAMARDEILVSPTVLTSGYTYDLNAEAGTAPGRLVVHKFMGSTPDTTVSLDYVTSKPTAGLIQIWRGVDPTTPVRDSATFTGTSTGMPDASAVSSIVSGDLVFAYGFFDDADVASTTTAPSGYSNFLAADTGQASTSLGATVMVASKVATGTSENPPIFGGSTTGFAWKAFTLALLPAPVSTVTGTAAITLAPDTLAAAGSLSIRATGISTGDLTVDGATLTVDGATLAVDGEVQDTLVATGTLGPAVLIAKVAESTFILSGATGAKSVAIPGSPINGDMVIIAMARDDAIPTAPILTAGYTLALDAVASIAPARFVAYKFMGSTPDTTVSIDYVTSKPSAGLIQIWRGVNITTPIEDDNPNGGTSVGMPDSNSVTPITNGARVISFGFFDDIDVASTTTAPSGYGDFLVADTGQASATNGATVMVASRTIATAGSSENPPIFGGSATGSAWKAYTLSLKPGAASVVAIVEAPDTLASAGKLSIAGAAALVEAPNVLAAAGSLPIRGTVAVTSAPDTVASAGVHSTGIGTLAKTEAPDTLVAVAGLPAGGGGVYLAGVYLSGVYLGSGSALAVTEAPDTITAAGSGLIGSVLARTEAPDTIAAAAKLSIVGTTTYAEDFDTVTAAGSLPISGEVAVTSAPDAVVATGGTSGGGLLAVTEAPDTVASAGSLLIRGTLAVTSSPDTVASASSLLIRGTLAVTSAADTVAAAGVGQTGLGNLTRTEAPDTLSAAGASLGYGGVYLAGVYQTGVYLDYGAVIGGAVAKAEAPDTLAAAGKLSIRGTLALTLAPDTAQASSTGVSGGVYLPGVYLTGVYVSTAALAPGTGTFARTEAPDTLAAVGRLPIKGTLALTLAPDTLSTSGNVPIKGTLTRTNAPDTLVATLSPVFIVPPSVDGPVGDRIYIVESLFTTTFALPPGETPSADPVAASWEGTAAFPVAGRGFEAEAVGSVTLPPYDFRVANIDFNTRPTDPDRPSGWWDGRLIDPGDLTRAISLTSVGAGSVESSGGTIVIDNTDGVYDSVLDDHYAVSQQVLIRQADPSVNWASFDTLWQMRITGVNISETELTLEVEEPVSYAQNYFPVTYYNGLGGIAGDPSLLNVQRPIVFGRVYNYKPLLIDPVTLVYQLHDGPMLAVLGVFDGGAALTYHASYASYALMVAATIPAGKYGQCDAEGVIRLGGSPVKDVTVHMDGHVPAGTNVRSIASWLATQLEPQIWVDIETAAFNLLPLAGAGWVWTEPFSYQEALSRFVGDVGWVWGSLQTGPLTVGQLLPPDNTGIVREFDETDILRLERLSLPAGYESTHHRRIVRYHKNWTVQPQNALVVTAAEPTFRQQEWRTVFANSATDARNALDAPVLDTSLNASAFAQDLADALIVLHGERRKLFSLQTKIYGEVPPLTSNVLVTYPRLGLDGGVPLRVISLQHNFREGLATMLLWG